MLTICIRELVVDNLNALKVALESKVKRQEAALDATKSQLAAVLSVIAKVVK